MTLTKILISSSLIFSTATFAATAEKKAEKPAALYDSQENRTKLIEELLELSNSKQLIEDSFTSASKIILKDVQDPAKEKAVTDLFNKYYSWEKLSPAFIQIYHEVYSAEDLQQLVAFYKSDVGQKMLNKMPELMDKTMAAIIKINEENMPKMMPELQKILPSPAEAESAKK